jgi:outer membrane protein assembly factor BamB
MSADATHPTMTEANDPMIYSLDPMHEAMPGAASDDKPRAAYLPEQCGERLYWSLPSGRVEARDAVGELLWAMEIPAFTPGPTGIGMLVADDRRVLTCVADRLWALDAQTGAVILAADVPTLLMHSAVIVGDRLVVGALDRKDGYRLQAFDLNSGRTCWKLPMRGEAGWAARSGRTLVVVDGEEHIVCVDLEQTNIRWRVSVAELGRYKVGPWSNPGQVLGQPILHGDSVVVPIDQSLVASFNLRDGGERWRQRIAVRSPTNLIA